MNDVPACTSRRLEQLLQANPTKYPPTFSVHTLMLSCNIEHTGTASYICHVLETLTTATVHYKPIAFGVTSTRSFTDNY